MGKKMFQRPVDACFPLAIGMDSRVGEGGPLHVHHIPSAQYHTWLRGTQTVPALPSSLMVNMRVSVNELQ